MKNNPLIIAHRGASFEAPENTMASFKLALQENTDALELDVHKTKDGEIVVIHDEDTQRTCREKKLIRESTFPEIRALDAGSWKDEIYQGERIPTFKEIVEIVPSDKKLSVEIKGGRKCLGPVKNILESSHLKREQIVIMDFNLDNMIEAKTLFPDSEILWLCEFIPPLTENNADSILGDIIQKASNAKMHGINIELNLFITKELVKQVHNLGMKFYVWTVNGAQDAQYLRSIEVDGLTTDRPGWLKEKLNG